MCPNQRWRLELNWQIFRWLFDLLKLCLLPYLDSHRHSRQIFYIQPQSHAKSRWSKGFSWYLTKFRAQKNQDFLSCTLWYSQLKYKPNWDPSVPNCIYLNRIKCNQNHRSASVQNEGWNFSVWVPERRPLSSPGQPPAAILAQPGTCTAASAWPGWLPKDICCSYTSGWEKNKINPAPVSRRCFWLGISRHKLSVVTLAKDIGAFAPSTPALFHGPPPAPC